MTSEPFFKRDGDHFVPNPVSRGPWNPQSLHGRVIIGLLGHEIERRHGDPNFIPARLTVDMYRLPGFDPIEVTTKLIREGGRIRMVEAEFISGGISMAKASCQLLRRTENPETDTWKPPVWDVPKPADIPDPTDGRQGMGGMWKTKPITAGIGTPGFPPGQRRMWMAEVRDIVEGDVLTPFSRVAVACDFASPFANMSSTGLAWINSDVTLYLHRLPATEWIGFESVNHQATDGVAIGECFLYDEEGSIGSATVAALAQRRPNR